MAKLKKVLGGEFLVCGDYFNSNLPPARVMNVNDPDFSRGLAYYDDSFTSLSFLDNRRTTAISPNGRYAVVIWSSSPYYRVLDLLTETVVTLGAGFPTGNITCAAWSPDGSELALGDDAGSYLWRFDTATWTLQTTATPGQSVYFMAYTPDSAEILLGHGTVSPYAKRYNIAGNSYSNFSPTTQLNFWLPIFSPDGTKVAKGYSGTANTFTIMDFPGGTERFVDATRTMKGGDWSHDGAYFVWVADGRYIRIVETTGWTESVIDMNGFTTVRRVIGGGGYASGVHALSNTEFLICSLVGWVVYDVVAGTFKDTFNTFGKPTGTTSQLGSSISPLTKHRKLAGTVVDALAAPVARDLIVLNDETGRVIGRGVSSAVDGSFEIVVYSAEAATVIALPATGEQPAGKARVIPVVV